MKLQEKFKNPTSEYRGAPFWSWCDDLKPKELKRQIEEMDKQGLGGFFMHSRIGLITPYISDEWMNCIKASVDEAKKRKMCAYLYDEDRWPSGFAGGVVPAESKEVREKVLLLKETQEIIPQVYKEEENEVVLKLIKVFLVEKKDGKIKVLKDVTEEVKNNIKIELNSNILFYFYQVTKGIREDWFNGYCYVDLMEPKAVDAFISSTYEKYYKEVGKEFGKTIPGIFTDEPCYQRPHGKYWPAIPWTEKFPEYFLQKNGYDIREHLPSLFYETEIFEKYRYDFWCTATQLFAEVYSKKMYEWCEKHKIAFTGHYMCEDNLKSQTEWIGSAMVHYEYMQIPGIDHLGRNIRDLITPKQCSSVAHQLDRKRVLSETYGCSGWNLTFEGQKWIGDWEYVLGINLLNQHLCLYSNKGCCKRDHPPSLYYHQPWWKKHKKIADYFARLSLILSEGEFLSDIAVIHPIGSAWSLYSPLNATKVDELNNLFVNIAEKLCGIKRDYDFVEELLLEKYGKVEDKNFIVGKMKYKVVIIPPLLNLRENTIKLLQNFVNSGGKVLIEKNEKFPNVSLGGAEYFEDFSSLQKRLEKILSAVISVIDEKGENIGNIYYQQRKIENKYFYFLCNTSMEEKYQAKVKIRGIGKIELWNLFTGKIEEIPHQIEGEYTILNLEFEPASSYLISLDENLKGEKVKTPELKISKKVKLNKIWKVKQQDFNALTLDYCQYKIEGEKWSKKVPVFKAQDAAEKTGEGKEIKLRYYFYTDFIPKEIFLILENPKIYKIYLNGKEILSKDEGYYLDIAFRKINIKKYVRYGKNTLELSCKFIYPRKRGTLIFVKDGVELESIYVAGNFSVKKKGGNYIITSPKKEVKNGDLVLQGYPFFAGSLVISQGIKIQKKKDEKVFLEFDKISAVTAKIMINDKETGIIFLKPYKLDITKFLKDGKNKLQIELTDSLRNLLGPHHHIAGELFGVGPGSFRDEKNWTDNYNFIHFGIEGDVSLNFYADSEF